MAKKQIQSFSVDSIKAISETVRRVRGMGVVEGGGGHRKPLFNGDEDITIPVKNTLGIEAIKGHIYQIDGGETDIDNMDYAYPVFTIAEFDEEYLNTRMLVALTQDIADETIGRGIILGLAKVYLDGPGDDSGKGKVTTDGLVSEQAGYYLDILYKSDDEEWCVIFLPKNEPPLEYPNIPGAVYKLVSNGSGVIPTWTPDRIL